MYAHSYYDGNKDIHTYTHTKSFKICVFFWATRVLPIFLIIQYCHNILISMYMLHTYICIYCITGKLRLSFNYAIYAVWASPA